MSTKPDGDIFFHSLRHSFASNLIHKVATFYFVKELLGEKILKQLRFIVTFRRKV